MSWPIPSPSTLAQRIAAAMLTQQFTASDGSIVRLDPNAPQTLEQVLSTVWALALSEVYGHIRDSLLEMMVTTATENGLLPEHAEMWSTPRRPAAAAIGNVLVTASDSVTLPINTAFVSDGAVQWLVTKSTTLAPDSATAVPVRASVTGVAGNLSGGVALTLVSPVSSVKSAVTDHEGIAGGAEVEAVEAWRARIITAIRAPIGGGTASDYARWAQDAGAAYVNVIPGWMGLGTVGVIIAMPGAVIPSPAQVQQIQSEIDLKRPIRGNASVAAATVAPQSLIIALNPDTTQARQQITAELKAYFPSKSIGGKIHAAEIAAVISTINGTANDLVEPRADIQLASTEIAVLGAIQWQGAS